MLTTPLARRLTRCALTALTAAAALAAVSAVLLLLGRSTPARAA